MLCMSIVCTISDTLSTSITTSRDKIKAVVLYNSHTAIKSASVIANFEIGLVFHTGDSSPKGCT